MTLIYEYRQNEDEEIIWLITYWKATKKERLNSMNKNENKKTATIEEIEERALKGEDVTHFFSGNPTWAPGVDKVERVQKKNVQRVNVDITAPMLQELDLICEDMNIPRQSLIKTMLRDAMDRYFSNKKMRKA